MDCLRSKNLRTFKRFCFLCSTKLSRLPGCVAWSNSGTRESRDVRGLRPNRSSKTAILAGSDESGRVCLIQHARATYSSHRPGQALQSSANISWSHPPNLSTAPSPREWSACPKSSLAFSQWQRDFSISDENSPPQSLRKFLGTRKSNIGWRGSSLPPWFPWRVRGIHMRTSTPGRLPKVHTCSLPGKWFLWKEYWLLGFPMVLRHVLAS